MNFQCAHHELVDLHKLQPNPKNPNKHPARQIELLAKIIDYQGQRSPIVVSKRSGFITKGHGRLEALKKLGWEKAAVDIQEYADEAQEYADMVADNKIAELAEHDDNSMITDIKLLGIDDFELLGLDGFELPADPVEAQCDEDEVPEQVDTRCKLGDVWTLGRHRLMCGDSTKDFLELFEEHKPELCFTSPPYSDQRDYSGQLELDPQHLAKFLMAPCGIFAVNLGLQRKDGEIFPYWEAYIKTAKEIGLKFISWNIWDKMESGSIGNLTAMFPIEHEWIFVFGQKKDLNRTVASVSAGKLKIKKFAVREKSGRITYRNNGTVTSDVKKLGTVLSLSPYKARNENLKHPAVFPVDFAACYIEALTSVGESVYEPFGGSGSTLIACEKTNRKCFMMELDPHYCDVILTRWEKYTGKTAERVDG